VKFRDIFLTGMGHRDRRLNRDSPAQTGTYGRSKYEGQYGQRSVLQRHTHKQQKGPDPLPHLCKQEWKSPTPVRRRINITHAVLSRAIPGGWVLMLGMKVRSFVVLSNYSAFHRRSVQNATLQLEPSDELMSCCKAGRTGCTNVARGLRGPWPPPNFKNICYFVL